MWPALKFLPPHIRGMQPCGWFSRFNISPFLMNNQVFRFGFNLAALAGAAVCPMFRHKAFLLRKRCRFTLFIFHFPHVCKVLFSPPPQTFDFPADYRSGRRPLSPIPNRPPITFIFGRLSETPQIFWAKSKRRKKRRRKAPFPAGGKDGHSVISTRFPSGSSTTLS